MEFKFKQPEKIKVTFGEDVVEITPPTMGLIKKITREGHSEDTIEYNYLFLESLGFPEEMIDKMPPGELARFVEFLMSEVKKK